MALNDSALIIPAIGYIYSAPTGTAKPVDPATPATPWVDHGHTSEEGLSVNFSISTTKRRTWRARAGVRVSVDEIDFTLGWTNLQWDNDSLSMYFGGGDITTADVFGIVKSPSPVERALFVRLVDGPSEVDFYCAKAAIAGSGEASASPEDFAGWPLEASILDHAAAAHLAEWLGPQLGLQP